MIPDESHAAREPHDGEAIAEAVREMLRRKKLTLYRLAALSRARYPQQTPYHIRRNFYSQLRSSLSPTFHQVLALSELTGCRLWDWLAIFGFSLGNIPRLQAVLPRPRTALIDKDLVDPQSPVPFLRYRRPGAALSTAAPMSQLLERSGSYVPGALLPQARSDFVYARIGSKDTLAFPELLPGSIVRADPRLVRSFLPPGTRSETLFLVEHSRGLNCGRLRVSGPNRVVFVTANSSLPSAEFQLGTEARILGVVDLELRWRLASGMRGAANTVSQVLPAFAEPGNPTRIARRGAERPGAYLEMARLRAGLSFRSASKLSQAIAETLGNDRYFTSPGTLSDYEAGDKLPRHIHKLFTLAIVYGIGFRDLLRAFGMLLDNFGDTRLLRMKHDRGDSFFENIQNKFGDLPLFLASALPALCGLAHISLRDVFCLGEENNPLHPSLRNAHFVLVNRRSKKPRIISRIPVWLQPLYLLQQRDGTYLAASCAIEAGQLVLYAYPQGVADGRPVRRQIDADVVGQIVGVARTPVSPP
jgi:transcriptional regulator with XRE-family HTH domain